MFQAITSRLANVQRFDRIVSSKELQVGEIEKPGGGTELAIQVPTGEAVTLEPRAQSQLLSQWSIPGDHFDRLPRELQAATLNHFTRAEPKQLTVRAIQQSGGNPAARAVVSGKYQAFDSLDVLETIRPVVGEEWEIARDGVSRDEMALTIVKPTMYDVSARKVGDWVKVGLSIRNSEVGTLALGVEFALWRLICANGATAKQAEVSVRQRHIWVDRQSFVVQLKNAVRNVAEIGETVIQQLIRSHELLLPNLDPDAGKLQREVFGVLRRNGLATKAFLDGAAQALGKTEEASVFGLVQYLTDAPAKSQDTVNRLAYERVAGELMSLAA